MKHTTAIRPETERARLATILAWLNAARDGTPVQGVGPEALQRLLDYVESWNDCAPNGLLWRGRYPAFWKAIQRSLAKTQLIIYPAVDGWIAAWDVRPGVSASKSADLFRVDKLFADFLVGHARVAQCQREGCGQYFEATQRKTTYCTERCGKMATSQAAKSDARHLERHRRMRSVLEFLRKLRQSEPDADLTDDESYWKDQVTRNVKRVTDRWLNEAVLERLKSPESFTNCERCREIRGQILKALSGN